MKNTTIDLQRRIALSALPAQALVAAPLAAGAASLEDTLGALK